MSAVPSRLATDCQFSPSVETEYFEYFRDAVPIMARTVASYYHAGYGGRFRQFNLCPLAGAGSGNPAVVVSVETVIQVLNRVNRVTGENGQRAGDGTAFDQREVLCSFGAEYLQFVDTPVARLPLVS